MGYLPLLSRLTANQLGWRENRDFLVGDTSEDFARKVINLYSDRDVFYSVRQNALDRIREEYSLEVFSNNLVHV